MTKQRQKQEKKVYPSPKRAVIYVRTSTEKQSDKVSPEAQETDCRALCERQGYVVVDVYRDTERYRSGKRMVEPSGTRPDRPQLRRMLVDARAGKFDVIISWREDRLYRSYRPMLDVLDCIEETKIDIELAKETFDKRIAPVKAWAAKMELEAKHDRFLMGVAGRLNAGKAWTNPAPFGYLKDQSGTHLINPTEADSVKNIFTWYAAGETLSEIRRRLVASGAQQRTQTWKVKRPWSVNRLRQILKGEVYHTAQVHIKWDGETYHIDVPRIVDIATTKLVSERLAHYHHYPAGNMRERALVAGLTRCKACNCAMTLARQYGEKRQDGTRRAYALYFCVEYKRGDRVESCAKSVMKMYGRRYGRSFLRQENWKRRYKQRSNDYRHSKSMQRQMSISWSAH